MRTLALLLLLIVSLPTRADGAAEFLNRLCASGLAKTEMPKAEVGRFCACVRDEITPQLSTEQRRTLADIQAAAARGRTPSAERVAASGIRDYVIAAQASCMAAFYPPSQPITVKAGELQLTLRCDEATKAPEAFIYRRDMGLLTERELVARDKRALEDDFKPDLAKVSTSIDGSPQRTEQWEIDLTGEIVSAPNSAQLIDRLRVAKTITVRIERGQKRLAGSFDMAGKIPARWLPCGGVRG